MCPAEDELEMVRENPPDSPRPARAGGPDPSGDAAGCVPGDFLGLGAALGLGEADSGALDPGGGVPGEVGAAPGRDVDEPPGADPSSGAGPVPTAEAPSALEQTDASWLMEFEDEAVDPSPLFETELVPDGEPVRGPWTGRLWIASASLVAGALGAHLIGGGIDPAPAEPLAVAQAPAAPAPPSSKTPPPRRAAPPAAVPGATAGATTGEPASPAAPVGNRPTDRSAGPAGGGGCGEPTAPAGLAGGAGPLGAKPPAPRAHPGGSNASATPTASVGPFGPAPAPDRAGSRPRARAQVGSALPSAVAHGPPAAVAAPRIARATPETATSRAARTLSIPLEDMLLLPEAPGAARRASPADLAGLWPGTSIPFERVDDERRLLTPEVGRVRVGLLDGAVFEGRLIAVGERKVWLELDAGRLAVMGWQVERIEHLLTPAQGAASAGEAPGRLAGLPEVRVRTPGGVFYGKLLAREADRVTLITAEGARVTVDDAEVSPAGRSRSRLIGPAGGDAPAGTDA